MIDIEVRANFAQAMLDTLLHQVSNRVPPNKGIAAKLTAMVFRNFDAEANDGKPWAALAPATVKFKAKHGKEKKLQFTAQMKQSFVGFADNDQAGVGSLRGKKHAEISQLHEYGTAIMPARPMLPANHLALEEAVKIYQFFIARAAERART
jgi:phage gpG-like protein